MFTASYTPAFLSTASRAATECNGSCGRAWTTDAGELEKSRCNKHLFSALLTGVELKGLPYLHESQQHSAPLRVTGLLNGTVLVPSLSSLPAWPKVALSFEISKPRNTTAPFVLRSWAACPFLTPTHTPGKKKTRNPDLVDLRQVGREEIALCLVRAQHLHTEPTSVCLSGQQPCSSRGRVALTAVKMRVEEVLAKLCRLLPT